MKTIKMTIADKIAFLEVLQESIEHAESMQKWYTETDENGNDCPPTESHNLSKYNAYKRVIEILTEEA